VRCFKQGTNLGLHETAKARFTVYPNPTNTIVNIDTEQTDITVKIFNQLGQQIIVGEIEINRSFQSGSRNIHPENRW
jgi:hypothetical protein